MSQLKRTWIARCVNCKAHRRIEAGTVIETWNNRPALECKCEIGRMMQTKPLRGRVTNHKCNARCLASKGFVCECSCGGKNHGVAS